MFNTERIKEIRKLKNKTQLEVASLLDVKRSSYAMWEKGLEIFPIKRLITFCEVFNVPLDYIFFNSDNLEAISSKFDVKNNKLKEFRKENNLTQEKLAQILNTNKSVICEYEKGKNIIATPFLYTICKKYKISADYLLGKIDSPKYYK